MEQSQMKEVLFEQVLKGWALFQQWRMKVGVRKMSREQGTALDWLQHAKHVGEGKMSKDDRR